MWSVERKRIAFIVTCGGMFLCPSSRPVAAQYPIREDSGGVWIVRDAPRERVREVLVLGSPVADWGGLQQAPDREFSGRVGRQTAVRRLDNSWVISDVDRIHVFGPSHDAHGVIGRNGNGPGEFRRISSMCRTRGDTVVVADIGTQRTTILDRELAQVRTIAADRFGLPGRAACFDDGTVAVARSIAFTGERHLKIVRVRLDGSFVNDIAEVNAGSPSVITALSVQAIVSDSVCYVLNAIGNAVDAFSAGGVFVGSFRSADRLLPILGEQRRRRLSDAVPDNAPPVVVDRILSMEKTDPATHWPAFEAILPGEGSSLWIQDYRVPDSRGRTPAATTWTLVDAKGEARLRVAIPAGQDGARPTEVVGFVAGGVILQRFDSNDAAHLTVYKFERRQE